MIKNKEWIMKVIKQHLWETEGESYTGYEAGIDFVKALIEEADQQLDEKKTEIKKVVIPQFVADFITEYSKQDGHNISDILIDLLSSPNSIDKKVYEWVFSNQQENEGLLCMAWITGDFEIEKEKWYYVHLPEKNASLNARVLKKQPNGEIGFGLVDKLDLKTAIQIRLTEQEIKSIDERYWPFAVEVEGFGNDR